MPNRLIEEIITELRVKYPELSRLEIERVIDTPWKMIRANVEERELKKIHLIHLGVVRPTTWLLANRHKYVKSDYSKRRRNLDGLVQPTNE
jgi:hypothetical protein